MLLLTTCYCSVAAANAYPLFALLLSLILFYCYFTVVLIFLFFYVYINRAVEIIGVRFDVPGYLIVVTYMLVIMHLKVAMHVMTTRHVFDSNILLDGNFRRWSVAFGYARDRTKWRRSGNKSCWSHHRLSFPWVWFGYLLARCLTLNAGCTFILF